MKARCNGSNEKQEIHLNHFMPLVSIYTPMKRPQNQGFSDVSWGYTTKPVARNGLTCSKKVLLGVSSFFKILTPWHLIWFKVRILLLSHFFCCLKRRSQTLSYQKQSLTAKLNSIFGQKSVYSKKNPNSTSDRYCIIFFVNYEKHLSLQG